MGLYMAVRNYSQLPAVFALIFQRAFDVQAIAGGFAGSAVVLGIKRGLFSNEAGMGSAPNASASAHVSHPVKQGLVQVLSVFIDTLVICSTTAITLLVSGVEEMCIRDRRWIVQKPNCRNCRRRFHSWSKEKNWMILLWPMHSSS